MNTPLTVIDARQSRQALLAGSVGNFIEWYEFGVYGFLATVIAANFFSLQGESEITSLILTYAAFALAFFCRPIGAVIFGRIGDRIGRRPTLIAVLLLMTVATALIGVMPTYASIGVAAPLLLTLLRMFQGLFAGGEFGGAVSLMTEFAPKGKRGLFGAWQSLTVAFGLLAGAGLVALLAALLTPEQLHDWGWRIPFLLALPMGAVALWLRLKLQETPTFTQAQQTRSRATQPPAVKLSGVAKTIALGIGRMMGWSAAGYTFLVVMPSYLQTSLHATFQQALVATVLANVGFALTILPAGILSDKLGRKTVMLTAVVAVILFTFPLLHLLQDPQSFIADQRYRGDDCRCSGRLAGRSRPGHVGRNVPHPGALYRSGAGLLTVQCGVLRLRRVNHHRAYQADWQPRYPGLLRGSDLSGQPVRADDPATRRSSAFA